MPEPFVWQRLDATKRIFKTDTVRKDNLWSSNEAILHAAEQIVDLKVRLHVVHLNFSGLGYQRDPAHTVCFAAFHEVQSDKCIL